MKVTIAGLMMLVAASGVASLGVRGFHAAYVEGLPENYAGDSNCQDICVLGEAIPALGWMALAGAICGSGLRRSGGSRLTSRMQPWRGWLLLGSVLFLGLSLFAPIPGIATMSVWGGVFAAMPLVWLAIEPPDDDPQPIEGNPAT